MATAGPAKDLDDDDRAGDRIFRIAGLGVIAPIRELNLTREWESGYAEEPNIPGPVAKETPWSIDENLWSRSIEGGRLEDPAYHPPEEIYGWTVSPEKAPGKPELITLDFLKGVPVRLNGEDLSGLDLIGALNTLAGKHGIGRSNMIEDRILG